MHDEVPATTSSNSCFFQMKDMNHKYIVVVRQWLAGKLPVTTGCLVNHCNIVGCSFIVLDIPTIHKVKLSIVHQLSD